MEVIITKRSGFERIGVGTRGCVLEMLGRDTVHWPPIDPRRHPADERLWLIRTLKNGDLVGTYPARTKMRRAEMLALRHAQRLLRGDCARRRWIRMADGLLYIVRDRWLLVYQLAIALLPSRTIEPLQAVVMEGGPDRVRAMVATHGG